MTPHSSPTPKQESSPSPLYYNPPSHQPHPPQANSRQWAKSGHWSQQEKIKYILFIDYHSHKMRNHQQRRLWKVFKAMGRFLGTRRANQCRSHHLKMETYFGSFKAILQYLKPRVEDYDRKMEEHQFALKAAFHGAAQQQEEEGEQGHDRAKIQAPFINQIEAPQPRVKKEASLQCIQQPKFKPREKDDHLPKTDVALHNPQELPQQHHPQNSTKTYPFVFPAQKQHPSPESPYPHPNLVYPMAGMSSPRECFSPFVGQMGVGWVGPYTPQSGSDSVGQWDECTFYFSIWQRKMDALVGSQVKKNLFNETTTK